MSLPAVEPSEVAVGDYCEIWIKCGKSSKMGELPRSGQIIGLNRSIVTIETWRGKKFVGMKNRSIKAWKAESIPTDAGSPASV